MDFVLVFLAVLLSALMVAGALTASRILAPHNPGAVKNSPYECGEKTIGPSRMRFHVGYSLFALLFLVFDVEAAFLYPWAVALRKAGPVAFFEALVFVAVLTLALAYAWKKGALEWD